MEKKTEFFNNLEVGVLEVLYELEHTAFVVNNGKITEVVEENGEQ